MLDKSHCANLSSSACSLTPGAYAGFLRGGPTLKFLGFWIYMPRSVMSRAVKLRAFARGVWGHAPPPKKNFKNGAISCVLRAIFSQLHGKKSSKKNYK